MNFKLFGATNDHKSGGFNMQDVEKMQAKMKELHEQAVLQRPLILTHPDNVQYVEDQVVKQLTAASEPIQAGSSFSSISNINISSLVEIRASEYMERRNLEQIYHPPVDRFVEYEESDYKWLQDCGLGHYETIDHGPLVLFSKSGSFNQPSWAQPPPIQHAENAFLYDWDDHRHKIVRPSGIIGGTT